MNWNSKTILLVLLFSLPFLVVLYRILFVHKKDPVTDNYSEVRSVKDIGENIPAIIRKSMRDSNFFFVKSDGKGQNYKGFTLPSLFSWSERIAVVIEQGEGDFKVTFKSKCMFPLQVYAWGKNKRNAERFFYNLTKRLE